MAADCCLFKQGTKIKDRFLILVDSGALFTGDLRRPRRYTSTWCYRFGIFWLSIGSNNEEVEVHRVANGVISSIFASPFASPTFKYRLTQQQPFLPFQ
jgi:hypothetical protein